MKEQAKDYRLQGAALMGAKKFNEALGMFQKASEIEENAQILIDIGNAHASLGAYQEAIGAFSRALSYEPDNGEIHFNIGSIYLLQERLKKCIEYYNKAEELGFQNARLYINLAAIYHALGDQQLELRNYTKAIDKNPLIGDLYVKKAMILVDMGYFEAALDVLGNMRKLFPDAFEGYDLASRIYLAQGKDKKAICILDTAIAKFPNDINLKLSKIAILVEQKEAEKAEKLLKEIKGVPHAGEYKRDIIMQEVAIASLRNQPEEMKKHLISIVELEEGRCDEQARFMLMMTCNLLENYEMAYKQADCLDQQDSESSFAIAGLYYKGEFLRRLGREQEAVAQFKKAIRKLRQLSTTSRTLYEVYIYRALAHKQVKEYGKAIEMAEFITQLQPERADGYVILADIYKEQGDDEKSSEQMKIARQKNPELMGGS